MQGLMRLSKQDPVKGIFKQDTEDFVVEEITKNGTILEIDKQYTGSSLNIEEKEGSFSAFVLQKKDWNTVQALREISKKLRKGRKSFGFAGTKDRKAISTQLCSIFGVGPSELTNIYIKDIKINGAWKSDTEVKLGDLLGNRFAIKILTDDHHANEKVESIIKEIGLFPNYFGPQRFGVRENNFEVGLNILKGNFEEAAMVFLTDTKNETNNSAVEARIKLKNNLDFKEASSYFPNYLKYERLVLGYLAKNPTDFANALRKIPRQISLMFVHSVESHIFNKELEMRIKSNELIATENDLVCKPNFFGFPDLSEVSRHSENSNGKFLVGNIIGYDTKELSDYEVSILDEFNIEIQEFKVKHMPELNCKGQYRVLFAPCKGFESKNTEDSLKLGFSIPSGSYATSLLNELLV